MAASRSNLPDDVLVALEDCIKAAERYGYACADPSGGSGEPRQLFQKVQECRRRVVQTIEAHSTRMYEGGIDMGRAQEGAL